MTGPEPSDHRTVELRFSRILMLLGGAIFVFAAVALIFSQVIPGPHSPVDFLVIGTAATFVSLLTVFLILLKTWTKDPEVFFKRRASGPEAAAKDQPTVRTSTSA